MNDLPFTDTPTSNRVTHQRLRKLYLESIEYELQVLVDFITTKANEGDIFIVIGDHQPARVSRKADGWDTPVHIISKNKSFVESFYQYGFVPGLKTENNSPQLHHEGLYSLFMRNFLQAYGDNEAFIPAFMPDGVPLN